MRSTLNIPTIQSYSLSQSTDIHSDITSKVVEEALVLKAWESVATSIPPTCEAYSIELLTNIVGVWVKTRAHAFSKVWTMKFQRKYKKGTRKSLQPKRSEE